MLPEQSCVEDLLAISPVLRTSFHAPCVYVLFMYVLLLRTMTMHYVIDPSVLCLELSNHHWGFYQPVGVNE